MEHILQTDVRDARLVTAIRTAVEPVARELRARVRMTSAPSLLRARRLRIAAGLVGLALVVAALALRQPPRQGLGLYVTSDGAAALADSFSRSAGVPVTTVRLSTGPMLARIAAEADRPRWALAWVAGDVAAAARDRAGRLEHGIVPPADWTPPWPGCSCTGLVRRARSGCPTPRSRVLPSPR